LSSNLYLNKKVKMSKPVSNEVLEERIRALTGAVNSMHSDFKDFVKKEDEEHWKIFSKFSSLDKLYVTRREFASVKWVMWILLWILSLGSAVWAMVNK